MVDRKKNDTDPNPNPNRIAASVSNLKSVVHVL